MKTAEEYLPAEGDLAFEGGIMPPNGTRLNDSFYLRINNTKQYDTARQRTIEIGN